MDDEIPAAAPGLPAGRGERYSPIVHRLEEELLPAWLRPARENRLPVVVAIVLAAVLQLLLPRRFTLLPLHWLLPVLELALLATLTVINPVRLTRHTRLGRYLSVILLEVISVDNGASAVLLDSKHPWHRGGSGRAVAGVSGRHLSDEPDRCRGLVLGVRPGWAVRPGRGAQPVP